MLSPASLMSESETTADPDGGCDSESSVAVVKELTTQLEPELLRAVTLTEALSGFGRHWNTPDGGMFDVDPKNYRLSRPTKSISAFLSHDWASSKRLKVLALLITYNSGPAFCACFCVSVLLGVLRGLSVVPDVRWTVGISHFTFFFFFAFYQRLRSLFRAPPMVFLDKLCVAQHDDRLKQKGIVGLAAFLLSSEKLLVLLTPRYFTRLWCVLEIATFMKDPERRKRMDFMPLKTALLLLLVSSSWFSLIIGWNLFRHFLYLRDLQLGIRATSAAGSMLLLVSILSPIVFFLGMSVVADMEDLPRQLRNFRIQDAACYCCTSDHRHPKTGKKLPCDRQMVYNTLRQWYGDDEELNAGESFLERFSRQVREDLAPSLELLASGFTLPVRYTVYMVGAAHLPFLADYLCKCVATLRSDLSGFASFVFCLRQLSEWGIAITASLLSVRLSLPLWKAGLKLQWNSSNFARWCVALLMVGVACLPVLVVWPPVLIFLGLTHHDQENLLPVLLFLAWSALTLALYSPRCCASRLLIETAAGKRPVVPPKPAHQFRPMVVPGGSAEGAQAQAHGGAQAHGEMDGELGARDRDVGDTFSL